MSDELEAIRELADCGGCCLHVAISDGNLEHETLVWCIDHAEHESCRDLGKWLRDKTTEDERNRLYGRNWRTEEEYIFHHWKAGVYFVVKQMGWSNQLLHMIATAKTRGEVISIVCGAILIDV